MDQSLLTPVALEISMHSFRGFSAWLVGFAGFGFMVRQNTAKKRRQGPGSQYSLHGYLHLTLH